MVIIKSTKSSVLAMSGKLTRNINFLPNLLYVSIILFLSCTSSNIDTTSVQNEVKNVLQSQQSAWNEGDIEAFMLGYWYSEDLTFIGRSGITKGWEKTLSNYKKGYPDRAAMGVLNFEVIQLDVLSPSACYMIGKYTLEYPTKNSSGYFNLLWRKIDENWVIVSDHTSG